MQKLEAGLFLLTKNTRHCDMVYPIQGGKKCGLTHFSLLSVGIIAKTRAISQKNPTKQASHPTNSVRRASFSKLSVKWGGREGGKYSQSTYTARIRGDRWLKGLPLSHQLAAKLILQLGPPQPEPPFQIITGVSNVTETRT